jgi:5-(carboxyamino)imidazole ribonucleotide mutase
MGSKSDWSVMLNASKTLDEFSVPHDVRVLSAHRTPAAAIEFVSGLEARGVKVVIAAAGGAAHLAGVVAAHTELPVLGVPMQSPSLQGLDSLLSTVQMPAGIPVATFAIGKPGAINAALFAVATLALGNANLKKALAAFRQKQTQEVLNQGDPRDSAE